MNAPTASRLPMALRIAALLCAVPAALHAVLGLQADALLDPALPAAVFNAATLDSQNRFYGAAFGLHAALLWFAADEPARYAPLLRAGLALFFAGGCARLLSVAGLGWPAPAVVGLMGAELVLPPLLWWWLRREAESQD